MVGSMGRVASAGDNAAMESFFALLQKNVLNRQTWATRDDLRIAIVTWIERTYTGAEDNEPSGNSPQSNTSSPSPPNTNQPLGIPLCYT